MRCSPIASPAARMCWQPGASRPNSPTKGIAVLRFDFTGLGSSEGEFANSTFSSNVADLVLAADHLRQTRKAPAILIGHSLGGAAILAAAGQIPDAKAVVTIAAPSDPAHVTHLFADNSRGHPQPGQGRGLARRPSVQHQTRIPRRYRRTQSDGACCKTAQGSAGDAFADRRHRRHRQCDPNFSRRQAPQEFCDAGRQQSPAEQEERCDLCRRSDRGLGHALSRSGRTAAGRRFRAQRRATSWCAKPATASTRMQ